MREGGRKSGREGGREGECEGGRERRVVRGRKGKERGRTCAHPLPPCHQRTGPGTLCTRHISQYDIWRQELPPLAPVTVCVCVCVCE